MPLVAGQFSDELAVRIPKFDKMIVPARRNECASLVDVDRSDPAFVSNDVGARLRFVACNRPENYPVITTRRDDSFSVRQKSDVADPTVVSFPGDFRSVFEVPPLKRVVFRTRKQKPPLRVEAAGDQWLAMLPLMCDVSLFRIKAHAGFLLAAVVAGVV